jgi:hypothetical protein
MAVLKVVKVFTFTYWTLASGLLIVSSKLQMEIRVQFRPLKFWARESLNVIAPTGLALPIFKDMGHTVLARSEAPPMVLPGGQLSTL